MSIMPAVPTNDTFSRSLGRRSCVVARSFYIDDGSTLRPVKLGVAGAIINGPGEFFGNILPVSGFTQFMVRVGNGGFSTDALDFYLRIWTEESGFAPGGWVREELIASAVLPGSYSVQTFGRRGTQLTNRMFFKYVQLGAKDTDVNSAQIADCRLWGEGVK